MQKHLGINFGVIGPNGPAKIPEHKLNEVVNHDYNIIYESEETFDNTEFTYKVVLIFTYLDQFIHEEEYEGKVGADVYIVKTPDQVPVAELKSVARIFSMEDNMEDITCVEMAEQGLAACIESFNIEEDENLILETVKLVESRIAGYNNLLGFYLDRPQNRLGATGWDFLDGNVWGKR